MPDAPQKLPTIAQRLIVVVLEVNAAAVVGIIATMVVTEYLHASVRVPVVILLISLIAIVWRSVLYRQVRRLVEQPLHQKLEVAEAIAQGDTARRIAQGETLEFDQLANSINRMTEQLLAANQLRMRVEKLATMGRIAAGVSHEVGNPLSAIANFAHVLRMRTAGVPGASEPIDALEREIARIDRIMRSLLDYSRPRRLTPKPVVVDAVITGVLELLADQGVTKRFTITTILEAPDGVVYAERHDLEQVFVNLVLNAVDAMDREGLVVVRTRIIDASEFGEASERRRTDGTEGPWRHRPSRRALAWLARPDAPQRFLQVVLADSGTGVAPEDEERIFEPFFSTKQPGKGTGLGLAIVASTIEGLGGTIWVQRAREGGAAFIVLLPLHTTGGGVTAIADDAATRTAYAAAKEIPAAR